MLDIGQQQFLVLLLMVQAQREQLVKWLLFDQRALRLYAGDGLQHALVDLRPVAQNLIE